ncbi:MAG: tRNA preQ1(34) S-adenosylmethionine ribosyltransferase-isomerase QueA [Candidatus Omnitrophota bacterium]
MKLSDFDYELPKELIAQYPLKERDSCRMMVLDRKAGTIKHDSFRNITDYFRKDDLLVLNDTRVMPARLFGKRPSGGKVEVLLLKQQEGLKFKAMLKPGRLKLNEKISFNGGKIYAEVTAKDEVNFHAAGADEIYSRGVMPLPPYIKREADDADNIYYQTVYSRINGSIAAPTAGLHFTQASLETVISSGVNIAYITLHVGTGTFKPVKTDDIKKHAMDPEAFTVPDETAGLIEKARNSKARIFAVGTTSLRALETFACGKRDGFTDLFVYPGYEFRMADCLLTNFHLPRTTLFMLVCAFAGSSFAKEAYQKAVEEKYRFYSYGDAMLII